MNTPIDSSATPRHVFLDPDGSWGDWIGVIVAAPTGVVFYQQCAGLMCAERHLEGYYVPLNGCWFEASEGSIDPSELTAVFHERGGCMSGDALREESIQRLADLVARITFWWRDQAGKDHRDHLTLDRSNPDDIVEAWAPVATPVGSGVLVWCNCD